MTAENIRSSRYKFRMARSRPDLTQLDEDVTATRKALRAGGVPAKLVSNIDTRALRSGRRQTGEFRSNRDSRWKLNKADPQFGTESNCKLVLLRLFATLLEFEGAPTIDRVVTGMLEERLGRPLKLNSFRDELTLELMSYDEAVAEVLNSKPGLSNFHIGHRDPTLQPKHTPDNVEWRTERSNLIQGNLTLREARTKFVELIARYFELGEVTISPDP
jgi:hypothetical protein